MSLFKRFAGVILASTLMVPVFSTDAQAGRKLNIQTRTVMLRHVSADGAIHVLHWDDINGLPTGVIDVTPVSNTRHTLRIEGTPEGIAGAVQALRFVDIAPRRVRLSVRFALLRRPASVAAGHKLPSARAVIDAAFRRILADVATVDNNEEIDIRMQVLHPGSGADDEAAGIKLSPRVNDNGTVTMHGTVDLDDIVSNLALEAAGPDAMGVVEIVRTVSNGKTLVLGGFRVRAASDSDGAPVYLYVLITPQAQ
jgi:hypothetical protein